MAILLVRCSQFRSTIYLMGGDMVQNFGKIDRTATGRIPGISGISHSASSLLRVEQRRCIFQNWELVGYDALQDNSSLHYPAYPPSIAHIRCSQVFSNLISWWLSDSRQIHRLKHGKQKKTKQRTSNEVLMLTGDRALLYYPEIYLIPEYYKRLLIRAI